MDGDSKASLVSTTSIIGGFIGGLVHAGVAVALWNFFGFDDLWELLLVKPLNGIYVLLGMFALGFVPAIYYVGRKYISPAIVVAVFLLLSGFGSWLVGPVRAPAATPTPFALYVLLWVGIVALAGVMGRFEGKRKTRVSG